MPPPQESPHCNKDAGRDRIAMPPHPRATAALAASLAPRHGSSFSSPPRYSCRAEPRWSDTWLMINAAGCGAKSSPSRGAVVPVRGRRRPHLGVRLPAPPRTWRPTVRWGCQGGGGGQRSWGQGRGHGFRGAAAAAIVPGGICQHHCQQDTRSHGSGPAPVGGVAQQPPAPCRHDKGCRRQPAAAGSSSRLWPEGASC